MTRMRIGSKPHFTLVRLVSIWLNRQIYDREYAALYLDALQFAPGVAGLPAPDASYGPSFMTLVNGSGSVAAPAQAGVPQPQPQAHPNAAAPVPVTVSTAHPMAASSIAASSFTSPQPGDSELAQAIQKLMDCIRLYREQLAHTRRLVDTSQPTSVISTLKPILQALSQSEPSLLAPERTLPRILAMERERSAAFAAPPPPHPQPQYQQAVEPQPPSHAQFSQPQYPQASPASYQTAQPPSQTQTYSAQQSYSNAYAAPEIGHRRSEPYTAAAVSSEPTTEKKVRVEETSSLEQSSAPAQSDYIPPDVKLSEAAKAISDAVAALQGVLDLSSLDNLDSALPPEGIYHDYRQEEQAAEEELRTQSYQYNQEPVEQGTPKDFGDNDE